MDDLDAKVDAVYARIKAKKRKREDYDHAGIQAILAPLEGQLREKIRAWLGECSDAEPRRLEVFLESRELAAYPRVQAAVDSFLEDRVRPRLVGRRFRVDVYDAYALQVEEIGVIIRVTAKIVTRLS